MNSSVDGDRSQLVNAAIAEYLDALGRAVPPDRDAFLADHAEVAVALQEFLTDYQFLGHAAAELGAGTTTDGAVNSTCRTKSVEQPSSPLPRMFGKFELLEEIARGGMGVIYKARQIAPSRTVALKMILAGQLASKADVERFYVEAEAAAMLDHPHIVPIFEVGEHEGQRYFTMAFVAGESLAQRMARGPLPAREAAIIVREAALAVHYAHQQGVVHRDLKPGNVLVDVDGRVRVTDFGLAKRQADTSGLTHTGQLLGTPSFMPPEQVGGDPAQIGSACDVYSLGATLYALITGRPPFQAASTVHTLRQVMEQDPVSPRSLDASLPRDLETITLKCLEKSAARRYPSAQALADELDRYLTGKPILARRSTRAEHVVRWCRRNPVVASLVGVIMLSVTFGLVSVTWLWRSADAARQRVEVFRADEELARRKAEQSAHDAQQARHNEKKARQEAEARAEDIRVGHERLKSALALVDRARHYVNGQFWDDAEAAYTEAIKTFPELAAAWEERGKLYLSLGLIDLAAPDIDRAFQLHPPLTGWQWVRQALLRLHVGDMDGYRKVCVQMQQAYDAARIPSTAQSAMEVVRTVTFVPNPDRNPEEVVNFAESVIANSGRYQWFLHALGTAHYRAGQFEKAIKLCQESLDADATWNARAMNYPIMAMAYHRLDQPSQANAAYAKAAATYDQWLGEMQKQDKVSWVIHQGATGIRPVDDMELLQFRLQLREARTVLGIPITEDARLVLIRARALAGLRHRHTAYAEYARALAMAPADPLIRLEAHRNNGFYCISWEFYGRAADEYAKAAELAPDDAELWRFRGIAHLSGGDLDAYRNTCQAMLKQFMNTTDAAAASSVVEVCVCRPDVAEDWRPLLPLAEVGSRFVSDSPRFLAAAQYRAGDFQAAVDTYRQVARLHRLRAFDSFFLAMSHHQLGQTEDAERQLGEAEAWIKEADRSAQNTASPYVEVAHWGAWTERPETRELQREAVALIRPKKATSPIQEDRPH